MTGEKSVVERAFDIAQSGTCKRILELRKALKSEGFSDNLIEMHFTSPKLRKQLKALCQEARQKDPTEQHAPPSASGPTSKD